MMLVWACLILLCQEPGGNLIGEPVGEPVGEPAREPRTVLATIEPGERPYAQMNRDIRAFVLRESRAASDDGRVAAIEDLCALYEEIKQDGRLARSAVLQGYKAKLYGRLQRIQRDLKGELARLERTSAAESSPLPGAGGLPLPAQDDLSQETERWGGAGDGLAGQFPLLTAAGGGPTPLFWYAGSSYGGGPLGDYGDDLVRLIQRTVEPDFWDVNGGPGSIYFYRPLNALVVRATSEVHHDLGRALGGLRKAGGR